MLKLLKNEKLYSNIRIVYIIFLIIYALARQNITALQPYLLSDLLNVAVIGIAGVLVCWDVFVFKNIWQTKYIWLLGGFGVFTVISSCVGFKYGYVENVKTLANLFIQFCLLYVVGVNKSSKELKKEVSVVSTSIGFLWLIPVCISLYMYFADISYTQNRYLWGETSEIVQGFVHEHMGVVVMRLWGVFVDPNFASAICLAIAVLSLFVIYETNNKPLKVFHIINIIAQYLYIVLSNSRMGLLILLFVVLVGAWYCVYACMYDKKFNRIVKEVISVLVAGVCVCVCYASVSLTKTVLPYVRYGIELVTSSEQPSDTENSGSDSTSSENVSSTENEVTSSNNETESVTDNTESVATTEPEMSSESETKAEDNSQKGDNIKVEKLDRLDIEAKDDVSNGRFSLWAEGLTTVFKNNWLLGVGPRNYHTAANEIDPEMRISTGYSIHNSFVELLMGNGIIGTLILLVFFVLCAKDALVFRYKKPKKTVSIGLLMVCVLGLLACGMFIACLFYTLSGATILMFAMLGYAVRLISCEQNTDD